jgi:hypothetical protein
MQVHNQQYVVLTSVVSEARERALAILRKEAQEDDVSAAPEDIEAELAEDTALFDGEGWLGHNIEKATFVHPDRIDHCYGTAFQTVLDDLAPQGILIKVS